MDKIKSQSGSAHLAMAVVFIVLLLGTLGFVYWQNFMQPETSDDNVVATGTLDDNATTDTTPAVTYEGYLVLEDWGVRFKLPKDLGDDKIVYKKADVDGVERYFISTKKLSTFEGTCDEAYLIVRQSSSYADQIGSPISLGKFGDYYYGYQTPQASCAQDKEASKEIENKVFIIIPEMLRTIENNN